MANDLEEQVREELAASAFGWVDRIDHDQVLADGHRARRRRTLGRVGVIAAAALVAGTLGWAGLDQVGRGAAPAVVGTPSSAPSTVALNRVTLDLTGFPGLDYAELEVTLTTDGTLWMSGIDASGDVRFTRSVDSSKVSSSGLAIDLGGPAVIGLLPGAPRWILPVTSGAATVASDVRTLPSGDSVYLVVFDAGKTSQLKGVSWGGADGRVHDSSGSSPASTDLDFDGHRGTFFFTDFEDLWRLTFHGDSGGSFAFEGNGSRYRPYFSAQSDSAGTRSMMVALLPWNATDPAVDLAEAGARWTTVNVAGRTVVVVSGTSNTMAGMVRSISYTDEVDGRVTQRVR